MFTHIFIGIIGATNVSSVRFVMLHDRILYTENFINTTINTTKGDDVHMVEWSYLRSIISSWGIIEGETSKDQLQLQCAQPHKV